MTDRRKIGIWATAVLIVVLVGYFVTLESCAAWQVNRAAQEAARDISMNQPRYLDYGERAPYEGEAKAVLSLRYGVRFERVAGCVVSESVIRRCDAYNRVVSAHFGFAGDRDIFYSAVDELKESHKDERTSP